MRTRALVVALLLMSWGSIARADEAAARVHFRRGVDLYDKKQYAEALEEFREAYREKPSAGIKQNVALSLKGLGRLEEAATSFDEALDEGKDTLKEGTRVAMERELAALTSVVGTMTVRIVSAVDGQRLDDTAVVTVDGVRLPTLRRPVRVKPGIHVLTAHVEGFADPPEKRLSILAGQPVDAMFEVGTPNGTLTVRASVPEATIRIDGAEVGRATWTGKIPAGTHRVEVSAAEWATTSVDVVVTAGTTVDYPIAMRRKARAPEIYVAPPPRVEPPLKRFYGALSIGFEGENLRLSAVTGEAPEGKRRDFSGATGALQAGWRFSRYFALEGQLELGSMGAKYKIRSNDPLETSTTTLHWSAMPVVRLLTPGRVRFTVGSGLGVRSTSVDADVYQTSTQTLAKKQGSGVSVSFLLDAGVQIDVGPLFLEPLVFFEIHGVGSVRDDASGERMLQASPGARAGVRLGLGYAF